jgi:hypothetical protein
MKFLKLQTEQGQNIWVAAGEISAISRNKNATQLYMKSREVHHVVQTPEDILKELEITITELAAGDTALPGKSGIGYAR